MSQAVLFLISLITLAVLLTIMPDVSETLKQLHPSQNTTFDMKHGSVVCHEHQNILTQIVETVTEQKLSTDAFGDHHLKANHQTVWLRLKNTSIFNRGGFLLSSNSVGTAASSGKRLRRKSR